MAKKLRGINQDAAETGAATPENGDNNATENEPSNTYGESDGAAVRSMDELTAGEIFPKPDEEAIAAIVQNNEAAAQSDLPEKFNPAIHATDKHGNPSVTKGGKFRRKKNTGFINPEIDATKEAEKKAAAEKAAQDSLKAAQVTSGLIEQLSIKLISDDFIYSEFERESNVKAWQDCYNYYGGVNLTPPLELAMNHGAIIIARSHKPTVQSKFRQFAGWLKSKLKRKAKNGTHSGSRPDGQRQNNMGAKESPQPAKT